jgi:hypothetical protein
MKNMKLFVIVFLAMILVTPAVSQETRTFKNDFKFSYGNATALEVVMPLFLILLESGDISINKDSIKEFSSSFYGCINLTYERRLKKWVTLGISGSFNPYHGHILMYNNNRNDINVYLISLMPQVNFFYHSTELVSVYSGLAIGGTLAIEEDRNYRGGNENNLYDTNFGFAYQLNAFGIRIGKEVAGYAEFGFGYKGIINLGLSCKF